MGKKILGLLFILSFSVSLYGQLSDLHYLPPLKQGINNQAIQQQAIYLSTPEPTTFTVNVFLGTIAAPIASFNISNVSPAVYNLANGDNNITLVNNANTGIVLNNSGLRFESPSGNRFYVNYRGYSSAQAASLTSKGRVSMGTRFKWGGVPNLGAHSSKSNTLGIMATEDNTVVNVFGYDPRCEFRLGNNVGGITSDTYQINLNANESFVFEAYLAQSTAHVDGWIGTSIVSDKDIVISNGSLNFGRQANASNRDAGIDQPVPENRLGKDYIFVRGNGGSNGATEFPLLIAIADNTQIFVNGSGTPIATINNGEYFEVPSNLYSSNSVGANMFVQTSKDVYAYQCMGGASQVFTQGLNFVAPVNCLLPDVMDNIPDIRNMAGTIVNGGVTIVAATNTPDANIQVTDGTGAVTLPTARTVAGTTDWKTFFIPNLNGNVSVQSTGPIAVGFFGYNGARGVAGYFSGFDTVPVVDLEIRGGGGCFVGSSIFEATGNFDAYQWFGNGVLIPGANGPNYNPSTAGDYFVRGTKGPCTYDSQSISAYYCDPDVVLDKSVDNAEIMEGETATFTISARNLGVGPVTNLQITDNIPSGLTLESTFTITGSWSGNTWNIGTLEPGETAVLELQVRADEIDILPLLSLTNTATNSQDQIDNNISDDSPSARITVHNDYDNDGVKDSSDLDDDNDGILDEDECDGLAFNISGGNAHSANLTSPINHFVLDIFNLDNSLNLQINGNDLAGEIQFQNSPGNAAKFSDGFGYGENGLQQVYRLTGSQSTPLLRLVVDEFGQFNLYGSKTSNGPLEPMFLTSPPNTVNWNASGNNTVVIDQQRTGPTNMRAHLLTTACDTDGDGLPNHLDLDSDGDGCSDANEFYKDNNADGGDDGEYGSGAPAVDPSTGMVTSASYNQVSAPVILVENTSEDLGGNDINGQNVSLGQTLQYVLRFQNTGDDDAIAYTIRNILPANVTLDNVDISDAPGTTHNHDLATNTVNFNIPNNLVEIGDPEYSIRMTVTIALNCSDFVTACSSDLVNYAYSTYESAIDSRVFTDDNGVNTIASCNIVQSTANNNILNDLTNCNEARTVQLCGENVILAAGSGFTTYNWVLDTNENGQVDGSDTVLNDSDPDNNPSTLLVTNIGNYIVEKSSNGSCPDLIERITVERFGSVQTNPIIAYFNSVNGDSNPDNDLQGEIVTCSVDGDLLPKIFLCGANDEATIQLGITDAQSIVWEKLDEASCSDSGADCANKNGSCTWNPLATEDNFNLTESGEYRVVISFQNGCFSRFYFNVFKNELDINHTSSDILCERDGEIRITNIGAGYGFQLLDVTNDAIVVPFSANNGPTFEIDNSGTYKVQITQLNPLDNTPIAGSCIFETEDIGILERNFSVNLSSAPADCNDLGTVSVQTLNALPNYSYELRLDDGSNAGLGSLVDSQPTLNANTHTFTNVNPENYIVVTTTEDGCRDSQHITVGRIAALTLGALTSENITCTAGIVNLNPNGGLPNPDYEMAIWSKDGVELYSDPTNIPASDFQTTANFLFGYRGNPITYSPNEDGVYTFIVKDSNGCYAISNSVVVDDLDSLSLSASHTAVICADSSTASLTVGVSGGTAPYRYSLDGGTNFQTTDTFVNLSAGQYAITVMDSSRNGAGGCLETIEYEIDQPFALTASPAIVEDASCSSNGALVKILNTNGGQAPYSYSFDGGGSFNPVNSSYLLPGDYQLAVRDGLGCTATMNLTVPNSITDPSFDSDVNHACDGLGTITITASNTTDFTYSYSLDGSLNSPSNANTFSNVSDGTHTVTVGFSSSLAQDQSTLLFENFGAGVTTSIGEIGPGYCYEPQDGRTTNCNLGPAGILVNGEYTVTNFVTNPIPSWRNPNDHSGLTDGRFLAIDVSTLAGDHGILWARRGIEVLPNQDITLSFWAYNLLQTGSNGNNPEILIELVDASGTVITSIGTAEIPKNNNADDWHNREVILSPGAETAVDIVLRTNLNSDFGNDLILDDISVSQLPEFCEKTNDITVVVEANKNFVANLLSSNDPSCNGGSDGSIRFEVLNFDASTGFEYSLDGINWSTSMVSPITTANTLADGTYTVDVRRVTETSCTSSFSATLNQPTAIVPSLNQTAAFTCFNTGATLEASATGGTPSFEYQLENTANAIIRPYQLGTQFLNVPDGAYVLRVRDTLGCEIVSGTTITVDPPTALDFDLSATACYDGLNNATVTATVNTGNGDYQFRINGGAWVAPTPTTATTHTFSGLSNGNYDIEVTDGYGCISAIESIAIRPNLRAQIEVVDVSACADGTISVTALGGDSNFVYAFLTTGSAVLDSDFGALDTFTVTSSNVGDYDVYVRDNNGAPPYCRYTETLNITNSPTLAFTAVPVDAECFGGSGSIAVNITSGDAAYDYELVDIDNGVADQTQNTVFSDTKTYFNLSPGTYDVIITDANGCSSTASGIVVAQPDELTANITGITPATCTGDPNDFGFAFDGYPATLGTIEFSADDGATWVSDNSVPGTTDQLTGYLSGDTVYPSMRTVDGSGNTICQTDLGPFVIPYPLDDLDITILPIIVNCSELQVTVRGKNGTAPYEYTYEEDPANFNSTAPANGWSTPSAAGATHTFSGLIPGRTYSFYVRDFAGCVRQSSVNVNDVITNPMEITASYQPTCNATGNGSITYAINDTDGSTEPQMNWTLYDVNDNSIVDSGGNIPYSNTIAISSLPANEYYIVVTQVDAGGTVQCNSGSENLRLEELDTITADLDIIQHITCEGPGIVHMDDIRGGGGTYSYTVTGPAPFTTISGTTDNPIEIPSNSPAGNYSFEISDQYGCSNAIGSVALTLASNPVITSIDINNCNPNVTVNVNATSMSPNILYSIDGGATYSNNAGAFNNIAIGTYTVVIKDGNGCTASQAIEVHPNLQATVSLEESLGCGVGQEAEILIEVTSGSGNYDYEILDTSGTFTARQPLSVNPLTVLTTSADTYTVRIFDTDTSGPECERTFTVEVNPAVNPDFSVDPIDVSCFGRSDGSISVIQVNNGSNPLVYALTPNNGTFNMATATFEGLPMGTYSITATGSNGCRTTRNSITVDEPAQITFDAPTVIPFGCTSGNSENNAVISIETTSIMGGSGTYTRFEFVNDANGMVLEGGSNSSHSFTNRAGGDVLVRVFDNQGCFGERTVTIPPYDELTTATVQIDRAISCTNSGEDINIDAIGTESNYGANPANYEFRLLPATTYQTSNLFLNLQPGTYTFGVRNVNTGCELTVDHKIDEPNTFDLVVEKLSDVICHGDNGSIRISITDAVYTGGFTWNIFNTNGTPADRLDDGPAILSGSSPNLGPTGMITVPAGNYLVEVVQSAFPNCTQVRSVNITSPSDPLSLAPTELSDVGCSNDQGSANITPTGGLFPYTIVLTNNTTGSSDMITQVNSHIFHGLSAGLYTVEVTDSLGCNATFTDTFELLLPDPITGNMTVTELLCEGDTDATVNLTLNPRNVVSSYRFILNQYNNATGTALLQSTAPRTTSTFDNLSSGFYSVSVFDDMGCSFESTIETIAEPIVVSAQLVMDRILSCTTEARLELRATGGTGPYSWSADGTNFNAMNGSNGANTHLFQNVGAGAYEYFIRDDNNCISAISNRVAINAIEDLTLNIDTSSAVVNCNGESTALVNVIADGGLGNYQYALFSDIALLNEIRPNQNDGTFADLPEGSYFIRVQSEDCQIISQEITVQEPEPLDVESSFTNVTCTGANDGTIVVELQGGVGPYQYAISPNLNQADEENTFENLNPGDYTVIAQDKNGCFVLLEYTITEPSVLEISAQSQPEICESEENGSIALTINGGTAPYSTRLLSETDFVQDRTVISNLAGGDYIVYVRDAQGCEENLVVSVDYGTNLTAFVEPVYGCNGTISNNYINIVLEDESITDEVLFALDSTDPNDMQLNPFFRHVAPGEHYIAISHNNGCLKTYAFEIEAFDALEISVNQTNLNEITATINGGREEYTVYFGDVNNGTDTKFYINRTDTYLVRVVDENGCEATASIFMEFIDIEIPNFFTPDGDGNNDLWIPKNIEQCPDIFIRIFDRYGREVYKVQDNSGGWAGFYQENELPTGDYWYIIKLNGANDDREFVGHFTLYR